VLRAAESEPQIVTKHGEEIAVVIDIAEYRRLRGERSGLLEYLREEPFFDDDFAVERSGDLPREIGLAD